MLGAFMGKSPTNIWRYAALLRDINSNHLKAYHNFYRMYPDDYDELLHSSCTSHKDTNCRQAISLDERTTCRRNTRHVVERGRVFTVNSFKWPAYANAMKMRDLGTSGMSVRPSVSHTPELSQN